jgi:hypothetical protein
MSNFDHPFYKKKLKLELEKIEESWLRNGT